MIKTPIFIGNWKMHLLSEQAVDYCKVLNQQLDDKLKTKATIGIAPSYTALSTVAAAIQQLAASWLQLGAQNVHWEAQGAHTAEISAEMLLDVGCQFVIVGHSERRQFYGETNQAVSKRAAMALKSGLLTIVCIGESECQYRDGTTEQVIKQQLNESLQDIPQGLVEKLIIAYEPIWAIGTGLTASSGTISEVHTKIRNILAERYNSAANSIPILYGGSTKPENAAEILRASEVAGVLVGGASLKPESFTAIITAGINGFAEK